MLKDRRIALEVCPTSKFVTGASSSINDRPVVDLLRSGIRIMIADDDPSTFSTNIVLELELLRAAGMISDELILVQSHGIDAAYCHSSVRDQFLTSLADVSWRH